MATGGDSVLPQPQRIGVVLVHGIGEQRRYEHLDWHARQIVEAIAHQPGQRVTVEIVAGSASAFHADQDSWAAGGATAARALVSDGVGVTHEICFHEVWWADVNERYSIMKQVRFWLWGLAIWAYPQGQRQLPGAAAMTSPRFPKRHAKPGSFASRLPLFAVCSMFGLGGFSVGIASALAQRLFNFRTPPALATLTNFLSGVKIFNQRTRWGPSSFGPPPNDDFLDTLDEPPRVSIRRRVIRTFAKAALQRYDAWYVVAHSQGTVAAFNGLMETPDAWPGYLDEKTWRRLRRAGLAGPGRMTAAAQSMPKRPVWAASNEVAYRARIFERLRGVLTLGSPLDKFATIWPARAPICRIPAFQKDLTWINAYDPLDPVSDALRAYHRPKLFPPPKNVGVVCSPVLLLAHLGYLNWRGTGCLADGLAKWLLTGAPQAIIKSGQLFRRGDRIHRRRTILATAWWAGAYSSVALLSGMTLRWAAPQGFALGRKLLHLSPEPPHTSAEPVVWKALAISSPPDPPHPPAGLAAWALLAIGSSLALTLAAGTFSRFRIFKGELDPSPPSSDDAPLSDPGSPPP